MLGREVLSISTPRPVPPVLVGSRLSQSRVSLSFWERCCQPPHPWQGGVQQLENSLSCLSFVLEGSFQIFPFLECLRSPGDSKGMPEAVPGLSRDVPKDITLVGAPTGCGPGSSLLRLCSLSSSPGFLQRIDCGAFKSIFVAEYILHPL